MQKQFIGVGAIYAYDGVCSSGSNIAKAQQEIEVHDRYHGNAKKRMFAVKGNILDPADPVVGKLWEQGGKLKDSYGYGAQVIAGVSVTVASLSEGKGADALSGASLRNAAMKSGVPLLKKYDADYKSVLLKDGSVPSGTNDNEELISQVRTIRYNKDLQEKKKKSDARAAKKSKPEGSSLSSPGASSSTGGAESFDEAEDEDGEDGDNSTQVQIGEDNSSDDELPTDVVLEQPPPGYLPPFWLAFRLFGGVSGKPLNCVTVTPRASKSRKEIKKEIEGNGDIERTFGHTRGLKGTRGLTIADRDVYLRSEIVLQEKANTKIRHVEAHIMALSAENSALGTLTQTYVTTLNSPYFTEPMKVKAAADIMATNAKIEQNVEAIASYRQNIKELQDQMTVDMTEIDEDTPEVPPTVIDVPATKSKVKRQKRNEPKAKGKEKINMTEM